MSNLIDSTDLIIDGVCLMLLLVQSRRVWRLEKLLDNHFEWKEKK